MLCTFDKILGRVKISGNEKTEEEIVNEKNEIFPLITDYTSLRKKYNKILEIK